MRPVAPVAAPPEPLPKGLVEALGEPTAYPHDRSAAAVVTLQTHISHVFITADRVYKLRKAVRPGFLDFADRRARNADCLREVALNRRLAPDVYKGVAPIEETPGGFRVGRVAESLADPSAEHCVVMRRLPPGRDALSLLNDDRLEAAHMDAVAEAIAAFHDTHRLGRPAPFTPDAWWHAVTDPVEGNFAPLTGVVANERLQALADRARSFTRAHADRFERRRRDGRAVDGHGDLHLAHVWFEHDTAVPVFVDCIEFTDRLRRIDGASEVAFLAMDLGYRGATSLAEHFLRSYTTATDDYHAYAVVDYFRSYRAAVRAKVAALAAAEDEIPEPQRRAARESATRHVEFAIDALANRRSGAIVATTGTVGTGKSTAAARVAEALQEAVVVSSDRVRKRLAGVPATEHQSTPIDSGIYAERFTQQVYAGLLTRAQPIIASGRVAVLDATFSRAAQRDALQTFAERQGVPVVLLETRCAPEVAVRRLAARTTRGDDPSDAGPTFHAEHTARFTPVSAVGHAVHIVVDTGRPDWQDLLDDQIHAWYRRGSSPGNET